MIVDLVRNDLGRVCEFGSVEVPALLAVEHHPGLVPPRVDGVRAGCGPGCGWADAIGATFPPGSVTGRAEARRPRAHRPARARVREACTAARSAGSTPTGAAATSTSPSARSGSDGRRAPLRHRRRHHLGQRPGRRVGGDRAQGPPPPRRWRQRWAAGDGGELTPVALGSTARWCPPATPASRCFDHGLTVGDGVLRDAQGGRRRALRRSPPPRAPAGGPPRRSASTSRGPTTSCAAAMARRARRRRRRAAAPGCASPSPAAPRRSAPDRGASRARRCSWPPAPLAAAGADRRRVHGRRGRATSAARWPA